MIIDTKLHIPKMRTRLIPRPFLNETLNTGLHRKVTLVTAPAGYGKSTLLSEWIQNLDQRVAWVSLDPEDNRPNRFWAHMLVALQKTYPTLNDPTVLRLLSGDPASEAVVAALINVLSRLSYPVVLVWDDFHNIMDEAILNRITYFLERLPANAHIYIASRTLPSLPLSRLRLIDELIHIGVKDLSLTKEESIQFMKECTDVTLSINEMNLVAEKMEGWIAGMRLVALSWQENNDQSIMIHQLTGQHQDVSNYFFEEILSKQSIERQSFLLKTSILKQMNAPLSEAVTGMADSPVLLRQLEEMNLFIVPLDQQQEWYRYHHLFQDFLKKELKLRMPKEVKVLHQKAGQWLERNRFEEEAMNHYLIGNHYDEALALLEKIMPKYMRHEWNTLRIWLGAFPEPFLLKKPLLLMTYIASMFLSGELEEAKEKMAWTEQLLKENAAALPIEAVQKMHVGLTAFHFFRAYFERDYEGSIQYSEKYVKLHPQGDLFVGLGTDIDGYNPMWDLYATIGSLKKLEKVLADYLRIWSGTKNVFFVASIYLSYGKLMYEWNRLDEAESYLVRAREIGITQQNANISVLSNLLLLKVYVALDQKSEVMKTIAQLKAEIDHSKYESLRAKFEMVETQLAFSQGSDAQARAWVEKSDLRSTDEISLSVIDDYCFLAILLSRQGKVEEAQSLLERLLYVSRKEKRQTEEINIVLLQSLFFQQLGELQDSFQSLEKALALAEPDGYIRTFLDKGQPMARLLNAYIAARQNNHWQASTKISLDYVKKLVQFMRHTPGNQLEMEELEADLLTEKEKLVLQFIRAGLSNKAISAEMNVSLSTVKTHINHLYRKLGVNNRVLALKRAQEMNVLEKM